MKKQRKSTGLMDRQRRLGEISKVGSAMIRKHLNSVSTLYLFFKKQDDERKVIQRLGFQGE